MVMLRLLKQPETDGNQPRVDIPAVIDLLRDEDQVINWDDADDTLDFLDSSYQEDLDLLIRTSQDQEASIDARSYSIEAIQRIEPQFHKVVLTLVVLLTDGEDLIRNQVISALGNTPPEDYDLVVPALVRIVKDWQSYLSTKNAAFFALVNLLDPSLGLTMQASSPPDTD